MIANAGITTPARADCAPGAPGCIDKAGDLPSSFGGLPQWVDSEGGPRAKFSTRATNPPALKSSPSASAPTSSAPPPAAPARIAASETAACKSTRVKTAPAEFTFDGAPIDAASTAGPADRDICIDKSLQRADIQVRYDGFSSDPTLNVIASPNAANSAAAVRFVTYTNYATSIVRSEIRLFDPDDSVKSVPVAVIAMDGDHVDWRPQTRQERLTYVLRVYDRHGRFDETMPKTLELADFKGGSTAKVDRAQLTDNNSRYVKNIPINGGVILVSGRNLAPGGHVRVMGQPAEVDSKGDFAFKQIVPSGEHEIDVAISDESGATSVYSRDVTIPEHDLFYVGLAEATIGTNNARGPIALIAPDQADNYKGRYFADGRLALYLKGKIKGETLITMSADTRDQPIKRLFTNFMSKDPTYLLRNLDPNRYYPVYGDDSTLVEDAPTRGKFYVRVENGDSSATWGNFKTTITGTEYVRYDRGLYGLRLKAATPTPTKYGERRGAVEGFVAEPGTIGVRDVFMGTGGSSYFLSHQNVTQGSERVTVEVRNRVTGLVVQTKTLSPTSDYSINYIQGRINLNSVLGSTAASDFILQSGGMGGIDQYVVVNYEYAPGLSPVRDRVVGGRASYWLNDHLQVGATAYNQAGRGEKLFIGGADVTARLTPQTYIKGEFARSTGTGGFENLSIDGGFSFSTSRSAGGPAWARRVEAAADLAEIIPGANGKAAAFWKSKDANFSGPGEITTVLTGPVRDFGGRGEVKLNENWAARIKLEGHQDDYRDYYAGEANIAYAFAKHWRVTAGVRADQNNVLQYTASPDLNQAGRRVDAALRLDYIHSKDWGVYGFGQGTVARTLARRRNDRGGVGGYYRLNERLMLSGEVSGGSLGFGGKVGGEYKSDDDRTVYANFALDPDRTDILNRAGLGILTTGVRRRFNDDASVFAEARSRYGGGFSGLSHAYGLDYSPYKDVRTGIRAEFGKLTDPINGTVQRTAISPNATYSTDKVSVSSRIEYRQDKTTNLLPYGSIANSGLFSPTPWSPWQTRNTYLMANSLNLKLNPDWRLVGRINGSYSTSTQGDFYRGNYLEGVMGFAYRPVDNDRLNMLMKYTFFYNVPSSGQIMYVAGLNDYSQRSHVFSADAIYDVNEWISVGGKVGVRTGSIKDNMLNTGWYDSTALLTVGRLDIHVVKQWDVTAELRRLALLNINNAQTGALVAVYRHVSDNFRIGAGYNFTRFSDDLTNLSTRNRGFFINGIGMF
ncbi:MAG: hypothetical protein ACK5JM_12650 [Rhodoblastus sp.]